MTVPLTHGMSYPYTIKFHAQTKKVKSSLVANVEPKGASSGYALPDSSSSLSIVSPFTDYFLSFSVPVKSRISPLYNMFIH
jgi:hypothetical protein